MIERTVRIVAESVLDAFAAPVNNVSGDTAAMLLREALQTDARKDIHHMLSYYLHAAAAHPTHAGVFITMLLDSVLEKTHNTIDIGKAEYLLTEIRKQNGDGRTPLHIAATIYECPDEAAVMDRYVACEKLLEVLKLAEKVKRGNSIEGLTSQLVCDFYDEAGGDVRVTFSSLETSEFPEVSGKYKDCNDGSCDIGGIRTFPREQAQEIFRCLKSMNAIAAAPKNELLITEDVYSRAKRFLEENVNNLNLRDDLEHQSKDGRTVLAHAFDVEYIDKLKGISLGEGRESEPGEAVKLANLLVQNGANINASSGRDRSPTICEALAQTCCDNAILMLVAFIRATEQ